MRDADNIRRIEDIAVHSSLTSARSALFLMGFIFCPHSPRCVTRHPDYLPTKCKRVGVFVDESIECIKRTAEEYALDYIQLHGHESPKYCTLLHDYHIIKTINISTGRDFTETSAYEGLIDFFLFDTKAHCAGGTGMKFDWTLTKVYTGTTPFLLSGGIGIEDAPRIRDFRHPCCVGIDVNSRFELAPGYKDPDALRLFLNNINSQQ